MDNAIKSIALAVILLGTFFFFYEKSKISSKEIPIIVVLAALAAFGRVPFAAIPGVQPTTFIVMISGCVFGPLAGFVVGALGAFVSNMFLGQGPWTIWQMLAWGLCGASCGFLAKLKHDIGIKTLIIFYFFWGFLFGWMMNLWYWVSFVYPLTLKSWIGTNIASFWFDMLHAAGNVVFMAVFGKSFMHILKHFKHKLVVTYIKK